jgi:hypothetical protein
VPGSFREQLVERRKAMIDVSLVAMLHTIRAFLDEAARAIVQYALKRGRLAPKGPRMAKTTLVLRGLLNDGLFFRAVRLFGVHRGMDAWVGMKRSPR